MTFQLNQSLTQSHLVYIYMKTWLGMFILRNYEKKSLLAYCRCIKAYKAICPSFHNATYIIYNCLVQPYFDYCCVVWDSCGSTLANKLQKLQNRAARVLTSSNYDTNAENLFKKLSWKNLKIPKNCQSYNGLINLWMVLCQTI
jgi:hypothetical protein